MNEVNYVKRRMIEFIRRKLEEMYINELLETETEKIPCYLALTINNVFDIIELVDSLGNIKVGEDKVVAKWDEEGTKIKLDLKSLSEKHKVVVYELDEDELIKVEMTSEFEIAGKPFKKSFKLKLIEIAEEGIEVRVKSYEGRRHRERNVIIDDYAEVIRQILCPPE